MAAASDTNPAPVASEAPAANLVPTAPVVETFVEKVQDVNDPRRSFDREKTRTTYADGSVRVDH